MPLFVTAVASALWRQSLGRGLAGVVAGFVLTHPVAKAVHRGRIRLAGGLPLA